jgi:hypothetical protein
MNAITKTGSASRSFIEALHTAGPAPDRADKMGLYGWLIGQWEMDAVVVDAAALASEASGQRGHSLVRAPDTRPEPGSSASDGTKHSGRGEIHFGWVLEGRAIQDVWILPGFFYGTTLRVYDPGIDAWHILWSDPLKQLYRRQIGRARGKDIVQDGQDESGAAVRWSFTDITPNSFHWLGERSEDGGANWQLQAEFFARRVPG